MRVLSYEGGFNEVNWKLDERNKEKVKKEDRRKNKASVEEGC
jgi:hypothetical protein